MSESRGRNVCKAIIESSDDRHPFRSLLGFTPQDIFFRCTRRTATLRLLLLKQRQMQTTRPKHFKRSLAVIMRRLPMAQEIWFVSTRLADRASSEIRSGRCEIVQGCAGILILIYGRHRCCPEQRVSFQELRQQGEEVKQRCRLLSPHDLGVMRGQISS